MEKNDYDKKRYTQMKILKQDMEIMKKEIEQLKDALKKKVETETKIEQKVETPEIPEIPKVETLETPKVETSSFIGKAERLETRRLQYGIPVQIDEMEIPRVIHYKEMECPPTKFTRHQKLPVPSVKQNASKTMKMWK